jgi:hypothetical protein
MTLITLILLAEIGFGWLGLLYKKFFNSILIVVFLWAVFFPFASWLHVDKEPALLFATLIGALSYFGRAEHKTALHALFPLLAGYCWFVLGFRETALLLVVAFPGSVLVQMPLRLMPDLYPKTSFLNSIAHARIFAIVSSINLALFFYLYA